ncbi:MAG: hypothetical protein ACYDHH_08710 [Solirubrobacteraceae bacterium]
MRGRNHRALVVLAVGGACALTVATTVAHSSAVPGPILGRTVVVSPAKGQVFVQVPGQARTLLRVPRAIPTGSTVDTARGTVRLTSAADSHGKTQYGYFDGGAFQVTQTATAPGMTELRLTGGSFAACGGSHVAAAAPATVIRTLHGNAHGHFRTSGRYSAATVRGTEWDTVDECDGTRTIDVRGRVVATSGFQISRLRPGENEVGYCRPLTAIKRHHKFCISVNSTPSEQVVGFGIGLRGHASQYRLCVLAPSGTNRCHTYPIARYDHSDFELGVVSCLQDEGPGTYLVSWFLGQRQLGITLSFTATRPPPPFTLPCAVGAG